MIYQTEKVYGYSGKKFWQWFDIMPKEVRDAINYDYHNAVQLWKEAIDKYGIKMQYQIED